MFGFFDELYDSLLETDPELLKLFDIKERYEVKDSNKLVPQLYWGNPLNPKYVILGKNPSYLIDDEFDCKYFNEELKNNLIFEKHLNGDTKIINLLTNRNELFGLSYVAKWWQRVFGELKEFKENQDLFMCNVFIANIYGYYSKEKSPKKAFNDVKLLEKAHIKKYISYVCSALESAEIIFIMWKDSISAWEYLLNKSNYTFFERIKKKIYVVNKKYPTNNILRIKDDLKICDCEYKSL